MDVIGMASIVFHLTGMSNFIIKSEIFFGFYLIADRLTIKLAH